jgi:hypothetical protein
VRTRNEFKAGNADTGFGGASCNGDHIDDQRHEMCAAMHLKGDVS